MSEPLDPFKVPWAAEEMLTTGKQLFDALVEQPHFGKAATVIDALSEKDLRLLGFYFAAEQVAQEVERTGNLDPWLRWWGWLEVPGGEQSDQLHTQPRELWSIMRPEAVDEPT